MIDGSLTNKGRQTSSAVIVSAWSEVEWSGMEWSGVESSSISFSASFYAYFSMI